MVLYGNLTKVLIPGGGGVLPIMANTRGTVKFPPLNRPSKYKPPGGLVLGKLEFT